MLTTKKKLPVIVALAAIFALLPVSRAAAWDYVCLENRAYFNASLIVVYGFSDADDFLPRNARRWSMWTLYGKSAQPSYLSRPVYLTIPGDVLLPENVRGLDRQELAAGAIMSSPAGAMHGQCVDMRGIIPGTPFFALIRNDARPPRWVVCDTRAFTHRPFYHQQERPHPELWLSSAGYNQNPECAHLKEANPE